MLLNAAWLLVTQRGWIWASVVVIIALPLVLGVLVLRLGAEPARSLAERIVLDWTFGLYLGWVAVATCANITAALVDSASTSGPQATRPPPWSCSRWPRRSASSSPSGSAPLVVAGDRPAAHGRSASSPGIGRGSGVTGRRRPGGGTRSALTAIGLLSTGVAPASGLERGDRPGTEH